MQTLAMPNLLFEADDELVVTETINEPVEAQQSLSVILLTVAFTLVGAGTAFYLARYQLGGPLPASVMVTGLALLTLLGPSAVVASLLVGVPPVPRNLGWGCGLLVCTLVFLGLCGVAGGVAGLIAVTLGLTTV